MARTEHVYLLPDTGNMFTPVSIYSTLIKLVMITMTFGSSLLDICDEYFPLEDVYIWALSTFL